MDHLALYSRKCKRCGHLDPEEERKFECHTSNGNPECPASEVQFAVVGEAKRLAKEIKKARANSDISREVKILEHVAKRSAAFQQKFRDWST